VNVRFIKIIIFILLVSMILFLCTGCSSLDNKQLSKQKVQVEVINEEERIMDSLAFDPPS